MMSLSAALWMDRTRIDGWRLPHGCSIGRHALTPLLAAQPFVSIDALAALSALVDLAKDLTPSPALAYPEPLRTRTEGRLCNVGAIRMLRDPPRARFGRSSHDHGSARKSSASLAH